MFAGTPPMGWNTWNTFGPNISEQLLLETCDALVEKGYRDAGYEYVVVDDAWMLKERDKEGHLVPDPNKFPHGMKYVADYVHSKGMKFGIYSCSGVRTCLGYPSSFGHEFEDAKQFASWGVDFLKYDYCNFPETADCRQSFHTMSMALKANGRKILFSACQWGRHEPWKWMRSIGAHMYRSTDDIFDNFQSISGIAISQFPNLSMSAPGCFNDPDMLTVGMYGAGHIVGYEENKEGVLTDEEYRLHFALWCYMGVPLMIGGDVRKMNDFCRELLQNKALIALDQDEECRDPYMVGNRGGKRPVFIKHMADGSFTLGFFNLSEDRATMPFIFADAGLPYSSGFGLELTDLFTGDEIGFKQDYFTPVLDKHTCKLYKAVLKARN